MLIWGTSLYGKVDEVPGVCWVATQFFHLWFIPLVPMGSQAVFDQSGDGWQGAPIGLSGKSVLVTYARAALVLLAIGGIVGIFSTWKRGESLVPILCALGGVGGFVATKMIGAINLASYPRARGLVSQLRLPEEVRILVDLAYGQMHPDEAEERFERLNERHEAAAEAAEEKKAARREKREQRKQEKAAKRKSRHAGDEDLRAKAPKPRKRRGGARRTRDEDEDVRAKAPMARKARKRTGGTSVTKDEDEADALRARSPKARKRRR
jgi:hypothetical protein